MRDTYRADKCITGIVREKGVAHVAGHTQVPRCADLGSTGDVLEFSGRLGNRGI